MSHLRPEELLELAFEELAEGEQTRGVAHVAACVDCAHALAEVEAVERAFGPGRDDAPPADGLHRVLARVEGLGTRPERRAQGLRVFWAGLGVAALGGLAASQGGLYGALAVAAASLLVTLAAAPVLILESQRRSS